jgi:acylphosphatase
VATEARRLRVHGRVQGVFFRDRCRQQAGEVGVTGWVRNDDDGTVAVHVEGEATGVEALVEWCRAGPPRAQVRHVEQEQVDPEGHDEFVVR